MSKLALALFPWRLSSALPTSLPLKNSTRFWDFIVRRHLIKIGTERANGLFEAEDSPYKFPDVFRGDAEDCIKRAFGAISCGDLGLAASDTSKVADQASVASKLADLPNNHVNLESGCNFDQEATGTGNSAIDDDQVSGRNISAPIVLEEESLYSHLESAENTENNVSQTENTIPNNLLLSSLLSVMHSDLASLYHEGILSFHQSDQSITLTPKKNFHVKILNFDFTYGPYPAPSDHIRQTWLNSVTYIVPDDTEHDDLQISSKVAEEQGVYTRIECLVTGTVELCVREQGGVPLLKDTRKQFRASLVSPHFKPFDEILVQRKDGTWKLVWDWKLVELQ